MFGFEPKFQFELKLPAGLCVLQGGAAGQLRPHSLQPAPCCHCGGKGHGCRPTGRAEIWGARALRGEQNRMMNKLAPNCSC
jgi:hypothetical protein